MNKQYFYFANFKMYLSYADMLTYTKKHTNDLQKLAQNKNNQIILLISDLALSETIQQFKNTAIKWGGQNCALEEDGPFTGQNSAQSLAELEASCCLVGHSELRKETKRTNSDFARQAGTLLDLMISPIFCLGESKEEMEAQKTVEVLTAQLTPLFTLLKNNPELHSEVPLFFAYEPLWAIGSGTIPTTKNLNAILEWLNQELSKNLKGSSYRLIYGGSVNAQNIKELKNISYIDGFLIGKASLDFQEFKKIVD